MMKIEIYEGTDGQWFLRFKGSNGRVLGDAGEGYKSQRNAIVAAERLKRNMHRARVVVL